VTEFPVPNGYSTYHSGVVGPDGNYWVNWPYFPADAACQNKISRITPAGEVTDIAAAATSTCYTSSPLVVGSDKAIWSLFDGGIVRVTTNGAVTKFPLSTVGYSLIV
jgi:streptogramin lyase